MDYRGLYKSRRIPSLADSLAKRSQNVIAGRQEKQREFFWSKREQANTSSSTPLPTKKKKQNTRAEMLQKWKAEKMKRIEEAKKTQKPIFKVGVVQRKVTGSPLIIDANKKGKKNLATFKRNHPQIFINDVEKNEGVITRSKAKAIGLLIVEPHTKLQLRSKKTKTEDNLLNKFCKIDIGQKNSLDFYKFKVPGPVSELPYSMKLTFPSSPKIKKKQKSVKETKKSKLIKSPKVGFKLHEEITQGTLSVENLKEDNVNDESKLDEKKGADENTIPSTVPTPKADDYRPIHYSPFVTKRSDKKIGKTQKKNSIMDVDEQIKKEEKEFQSRIFSFRKYIEFETNRLLKECDKWKCICQEFQKIPAEIEGDINSVIGKTKLLTSDKFKQFKELIDKCENGDPLIKVDDLQGFQDWVSIEVEKINENFYKLEKGKHNNWQEETSPVEKKSKDRDEKVKKKQKIARPALIKSNIRSHIQAARKLLKEGSLDCNSDLIIAGVPVQSTIKPETPKGKKSILKNVLNSETKKENSVLSNTLGKTSELSAFVRERRNSGLEIMRASRKSKYSTPAKGVKLHVPLIKFRKGGQHTDKTAAAVSSGKKTTSPSASSLNTQHSPLIEDWQLPPHYRRSPLDQKEIDAINSGGAY